MGIPSQNPIREKVKISTQHQETKTGLLKDIA